MALMDDIRSTISNVRKEGTNKAREWKGQVNASVEMRNQQRIIEKKYADIGRAYYKAHKKDAAPEYAILMSEIDAAFAKIQAIKKQQDAYRGIKRCSNCGSSIDTLANFCPCCGARADADYDFTSGDESGIFEPDDKADEDFVQAEEVEAEVVNDAAEAVEEVEAEVVDEIEDVETETVEAEVSEDE